MRAAPLNAPIKEPVHHWALSRIGVVAYGLLVQQDSDRYLWVLVFS
jgi:hypothetical protein